MSWESEIIAGLIVALMLTRIADYVGFAGDLARWLGNDLVFQQSALKIKGGLILWLTLLS